MTDRVVVIHENDTPIPVASQPGTLVVAREPSDAVIVAQAPAAAVTITEQAEQTVVVRETAPTVVAIASPAQGPAGTGPPGTPGQPRWSGQGPPTLIIGASPGDEYVDTVTGDIYRLE